MGLAVNRRPKGYPPELWFQSLVRKTPKCWVWKGGVSVHGYGQMHWRGVNKMAYRIAYELAKGAIPRGLSVDHLCRNRLCVNPKHLELVTPKENTLRGEGHAARNARKKVCKRGHKFSKENTYVKPNRNERRCRLCSSQQERKRYLKSRKGL